MTKSSFYSGSGVAPDDITTIADYVAQAAASAAAAAVTYDDFDDRYLGDKSVEPTVDNDGDALVTGALYFNTTSGTMWVFDSPTWTEVLGANGADGADGAAGVDGTDGLTILNGTIDPTTEGVNGDFYIRTDTSEIFGPKAAGTWPAGVSLVGATGAAGADGLTVLNGAGDPTTEGANGDFYIQTTDNEIWGPKAGGSWPGAGVSLVGPTGSTGAAATIAVGTVGAGAAAVVNSGSSSAAVFDFTLQTGDTGAAGADGVSFVWQAAWTTATAYVADEVVENNGNSYICISGHTSGATDEPGVGASEATYWDLMAAKGADGAGVGDVVGPASAVDSNFAAYDTTTGKLIKDSGSAASTFAAASHTHVEADITDLQAYLVNVVEDTTPQLGGNLDAQSKNITALDNLQFDTSPTTPLTAEGSIYWDADSHTLALKTENATPTLQVGQESWIRVYNDTGVAIPDGSVVYVSGKEDVEDRLTVALAQADDATTAKVLGFSTHEIGIASFGYVTQFGYVNGVDTSSYADGASIYLSTAVAGAFTDTEPAAPNSVVFLGFVVDSAVSGNLFITTLGNTSGAGDIATSRQLIQRATKASAGTIAAGLAVVAAGYNLGAGRITVEVADNSTTAMPAVGVTVSSVTNSVEGDVLLFGLLTNVDTTGTAINDPVYVGTAGALTFTKPTGSNAIQRVGTVVRVNGSTGVILIEGAGRTNDVPNFSAADKFWYGGTGGVTTEGDTTSVGRAILSSASYAAMRTLLNVADGADVTSTNETSHADVLVDGDIGGTVQAEISGATIGAVTVAGTDKVLIQDVTDTDNLKTVTAQSIADLYAGIQDIVGDTTPQLGGSLDVNGQKIVSVTNGNIDIEPNGTGNVLLGNFTFDADQTVGAGQDNFVLTYDNAGGLISLEAAAGGGGGVETVDVQTFTSGSGTWTKPTGDFTFIRFQVWGGGGSGAKDSGTVGCSGGSGGGYMEVVMPFASSAASYAYVVGAGGAAVSSNGDGNAGVTSSVGTICVATGGGAGNSNNTSDQPGGPATTMSTYLTDGGVVPVGTHSYRPGMYHWVGGVSDDGRTYAEPSVFGGGAGGSQDTGVFGNGSDSAFGGNGGDGGATGSAGTQPGGGGGASSSGNSGAGGAGKIIITSF